MHWSYWWTLTCVWVSYLRNQGPPFRGISNNCKTWTIKWIQMDPLCCTAVKRAVHIPTSRYCIESSSLQTFALETYMWALVEALYGHAQNIPTCSCRLTFATACWTIGSACTLHAGHWDLIGMPKRQRHLQSDTLEILRDIRNMLRDIRKLTLSYIEHHWTLWACRGIQLLQLCEHLVAMWGFDRPETGWNADLVCTAAVQHPIPMPSKRPAHNVSDMSVGTWKTLIQTTQRYINSAKVESFWIKSS